MSEKTDNLLILARRAKGNGDNASAARYYEQVMMEDPNDPEAVFYYDYCTAAACVIRDIAPAADRIGKAFRVVSDMMINANTPNKDTLLLQFAGEAISLLATMRNSAYNHYMQFSSTTGALNEYKSRVMACGQAAVIMGSCFYNMGNKQSAADLYQRAVELYSGQANLDEWAVDRIKEVYPDYEPKKAGCYVATAVYGSYDCPQVWTLRRYRDDILATTWLGRAFIKTYYAISPTLVKWFGETNWFKNMWRGKLDRMVKKLQAQGVEDTPYEDRNW